MTEIAERLDKAKGLDHVVWLLRLRILVSAIGAAAELAIADHVDDKGTTLEDLARATATDEDALYRLMRCLIAAGFFREMSSRVYAHNELSEGLRSGSAKSMRSFALMSTQEWFSRTLDGLASSVRSGKGALEDIFGQKPYEYLQDHPAETRLVQDAMADFSRHYESGLVESYDFGWAKHVVDVGGGNGTFLADVLRRAQNAKGTVAELPAVCAQARDTIEANGLSKRCAVVETDMFVAVPPGGDLYILKRCLHNWPDPEARTILRNIRAVLPKHGRVLVIEGIIANGADALFNLLGDLQHLALGGARERTEAEMSALFEASGLKVTRSLRPSESVGMIEGGLA